MNRVRRLARTPRRLLLVLFCGLLCSPIANAYTIILRGGRQVEAPNRFTIRGSVLTYEVAPGISVTLQLVAIDVVATERANNEPTGSFYRHLQDAVLTSDTGTSGARSAQGSRVTVTNRDLEPYERARLESEQAYERKRKELGLPSREELRRRVEREEAALDEIIARRKQQEAENYWRERQAQLQAEMAPRNLGPNPYAEPSWAGGFFGITNGAFGSSSRFGLHRRFPTNQGSPCGFNPGISCLQAFPFGFDQGVSSRRRSVLIAPGTNFGRRLSGPAGGRVLGAPGPRR